MTNAEARFNNSLRPRKPEGSLGRTAQDVHLDSHTAPEPDRLSRLGYKLFPASLPPTPSQPPNPSLSSRPPKQCSNSQRPSPFSVWGHWLAYSKALLHTRSWREGGGSWWGGGGVGVADADVTAAVGGFSV